MALLGNYIGGQPDARAGVIRASEGLEGHDGNRLREAT